MARETTSFPGRLRGRGNKRPGNEAGPKKAKREDVLEFLSVKKQRGVINIVVSNQSHKLKYYNNYSIA